MTDTTATAFAGAVPAPDHHAEAELALRVLDALLREDVVGLRTRARPAERPDGTWLRLPAGGDAALLVPVEPDGFQCAWRARLPLLRWEPGGEELRAPDRIVAELAPLADPVDRSGFDAFADECRQTLATMRLHARTGSEVTGRLAGQYGADPAYWSGWARSTAHDALAARLDHPVYPTARGRSGLDEGQLRSYAPEFHPVLPLRWLVLPADALTVGGPPAPLTAGVRRPLHPSWPTPGTVGLPELDASHLALPVHPLSAGAPLSAALRDTGLAGRAVLAEQPYGTAVPTLSMRTVAMSGDPSVHLKLPLDTATLGLRNRRTIKPGTLVDGAAGQRLLEAVLAREPRFRDRVLLADETRYAHAGHEMLAVLVRGFPPGLDDSVVLPMAALLGTAPDGRPLIDPLADRFFDGDPTALLDACLTLLFDWQTTLFGYGIALESHQQNVSLVLDRETGATRLRLLFKDNDGPRLNRRRLRTRLGADAPGPEDFDDPRIFTDDDRPLTDLFTTITVHLCAGAYAFGLARHGNTPPDRLLSLVRDRLAEAAERLGTGPGEPGAVLRDHVLDADRLPVKAMVTAGTLLSKERSGARDINKHYTSGPNYLLREHDRR
ncbi:IucA/IucC family protein [Streptomyces meridianus]|uniref:IucA/IucC family siderophore biosynthesis protein n=1 Tax=Streptomyces meridianus TaxID=2938945 RepID=A0ABT0XBN7_9ACTN|nr:IucA/IucC family protein [Streptomyces meridianus]MCM2579939.1 IucA/IucC family siderophore biosynthesis protein [Streptomyces meridianus]